MLAGAGLRVPVVERAAEGCAAETPRKVTVCTHSVEGMRTALHNYSPFLINSPVSAGASRGSTRGTSIDVHQEQWLLLQPLRDPPWCSQAVEPNICTFFWAPASPTGCHHPPLLFTILVLSHTGDAALNTALCFPQTVQHWSADSVCLWSGGTADNFGEFFGIWLPLEEMQTSSEVLASSKGFLAQGRLFGFSL